MQLDLNERPSVKEKLVDTNKYILDRLKSLDNKEISDACLHIHQAGGKRLRPLVFLCSAEMLGTDYQDVVPVAAGVEALHTATLLQDDLPIMDDDDERRGKETVHKKFGCEVALLSSNVLQAESIQWAQNAELSDDKLVQVSEAMNSVIKRICNGQMQDVKLEDSENADKKDYNDMISEKTAELYSCSSMLGGIISSASSSDIQNLSKYGYNLGMAFQMIDDFLDFEDDTGKDRYTDIENKKLTAVTLHGLNNDVPVFDESYSTEEKVGMLRNEGSIEYAKKQAQQYIEKSRDALESIDIKNEEAGEILDNLLDFTVKRTY
jgi:geranylgeranyl diphosphate synthase type I